MAATEFLVSSSGQMSVPAEVRRRWGIADGGRVTVIDLGDAVVLLPPGGRQRLLAEALSAKHHRDFVKKLDDPDLATTWVSTIVVDDHLLRDVLTAERPADLGGLATGLATTGLWLFRLSRSFADPSVVGKLSAPVVGLAPELQARFRAQLVALPHHIELLSLRQMAWPMADLQQRHRALGHHLSAAMVEALAAARELGGAIAVSASNVGPGLQAAAAHDGIDFHVL